MPSEHDGRSDDELVSASGSGDRDAFAALYRRHRDRVFRLALAVTCDRETAADVTQDVFLKLVDRLTSYRGRSRFTTWLHRVVVNACYDTMRKRVPDRMGAGTDDGVPVAVQPRDSEVADRLTLVDALSRLPEEFRTAVVLHDLYDHRYEEMAEILGIPVGTVKSRLARGRLRLAEILRGEISGHPGNKAPDTDRPTDRTTS